MKSTRKSSSADFDLSIMVGEMQFDAHWCVLRKNSVFFEELYSRQKSQRKISPNENRMVGSVNLKGVSADLFEKFLRYVYSNKSKKRQLLLKEVKDVLKFCLMFELRDLRLLMYKPCLKDLVVNMEATVFSLMSDLHQALLRFLHDRTAIYRTKDIAKFVAYEAYKEGSLEHLLRVLDIISGGGGRGMNMQMRLELLDIFIALFSSSLDKSGRLNMTVDDDIRTCVSNGKVERKERNVKSTAVRTAIVRRQRENAKSDVTHPSDSKPEFPTGDVTGDTIAKGHHPSSKNGIRNANHQNFVREKNLTNSKNVRHARTPKHDRLKKTNQNLVNETLDNDKGKQNDSVTGSKLVKTTTDVRQKTVVGQETRVVRRKIRKLWTKEKHIPTTLFLQNEERKHIKANGRHSEKQRVMKTGEEAQFKSSEEPLPVSPNRQRQRVRLFLTGGIHENDYFARRVVLEYDPINSVYITHSAMKLSRFNHGVAQVGKELFFVGGNSGLFEQLRNVESYSLERNEWASHASMHEARDEFSLVKCDQFLYAIGGHDGIHDLRSAERFNIPEKSWNLVSPMSNYRAGACAIAVNNRYIYVTGGFNGQDYLNSVERYDIATDSWTEVESMKNKRAYSCVVLIEHNIYVLGGFNGTATLSACETYNCQTRTWSTLRDMNTPRMNSTAVVLMGNVFTFGGECESVFLETVECFDINSQTWHYVQRLQQPIAGLRACVYLDETEVQSDETQS